MASSTENARQMMMEELLNVPMTNLIGVLADKNDGSLADVSDVKDSYSERFVVLNGVQQDFELSSAL